RDNPNAVRLDQVDMNQVVVRIDFSDASVFPSDKIPNEVLVPIGTVFRSKNPDYQNLVVVQPIKFNVEARRQFKRQIITCCTNIRKHAPNSLNYSIQRLPEIDEIRRFVQGRVGQNLPVGDLQSKLWTFTHHKGIND